MTTPSPSLQHYVPQFLLRRFGAAKKRHVWVYDKQTDRVFQASSKNVAAERGRYDFDFEGVPMTYEPSLAELEAKAATLTKRIVEARSLSVLSAEDRAVLATFLSIQLVRTNAARAQFRHIGTIMADWVRESAGDDPEARQAAEKFLGQPTESDERRRLAAMLHNAPRDFGDLLLQKVWSLAETSHRYPFLIGDHPVAMFNNIDHGPRGNVGVAVLGIEIYLPLSPEFQLCLYCPTLVAGLRAGQDIFQSPALPDELVQSIRFAKESAREMVACFDSGSPCQWQPENVDYCNSIQILQAERYVMSCVDAFDMVREMINEDPHVRHGRRSQQASYERIDPSWRGQTALR
jgi:hypothetical protein